ncbi:hypothetical protein EDM57_08680 [Brevibacillus gelatini]|uniref:Uncharacterized protein n=1 Tax=Brevibacillus gelatini TaxID=1655277 RepID=A0A3M8B401_9BACL|nr:hypothetical protein [Brevibacillus gelatini]RNB58171.1 hypothetical protein EDM57_08680 [Brevibacillus gelatini]
MLKINTHLVRTRKELLKKHPNMYLHQIVSTYPTDCFINIEDEAGMTDFQHNIEEFYNQYCITIQYNDSVIVSHDFIGIELWYSYIHMMSKYIREGKAVEEYGIDPIEFVLETIGGDLVRFSIRNSYDKKESVVADLPRDEFLSEMIQSAQKYYETMIRFQPKYERQYNRVAKHIKYIMEAIEGKGNGTELQG